MNNTSTIKKKRFLFCHFGKISKSMALKITQKHLPMRKDTSNNPTEQEKTHGNRIKICKISELKMPIWFIEPIEDAIGTQTDIAQAIIDKNAHYFLAVKDNQASLHDAIKDTFRYNEPFDSSSEMEAGNGRIEVRKCRVVEADKMEDKDIMLKWPGLKTLVEVTSQVTVGAGEEINCNFRDLN